MSGTLERYLPDEASTTRLGEDLAFALRAGDIVLLKGDLGAGKTTLARGLIRALAGEPGLEVPSPTFTLVQAYDTPLPLAHFDLYRLASADELDELGFDEALASGAALVEWPERADGRFPADALTVQLREDGDGRRASLSGDGALFDRVARSLAIRDFLENAGWGEAVRHPLAGDASARAYETAHLAGETRILMNAPAQPQGPPVRGGRSYPEIAHIATSVGPFVAIDEVLRERGFAAPEIFAADLDRGLLLLEDLGREPVHDAERRPIPERYLAAARLLADLHREDWPARVEIAAGVVHEIPPFDRPALAIETELLLDWYFEAETGHPPSDGLRQAFSAVWNDVFDRLEHAEKSLVLRDYHSPNLIWRDDRTGNDRLGLIDFQDAMIGPAAYDLASLAQDTRLTISPDLEHDLVEAYCAARAAAGPFDRQGFLAAYAMAAAQRNTKLLGIFVRLDRRDGKPQYLKHLPRIRDYLGRALAHPALAKVREFYAEAGILTEVGA